MRGSIDYIRSHYGVPAFIGRTIRFEGTPGEIVGTTGHYLRVRLDGEDGIATLHPTWHVSYDASVPSAHAESDNQKGAA